ncbi:hypothetical protein CEXT_440711 [Caerostris extrusa]|uniref:Secreted protein n=1 Tax=Caerostris extrusa TaxID=172846 RepID=A0AAV4RBE8_CAEEX|nr:hypothetical protein CEXT_440711 [Caerostris extrusa]
MRIAAVFVSLFAAKMLVVILPKTKQNASYKYCLEQDNSPPHFYGECTLSTLSWPELFWMLDFKKNSGLIVSRPELLSKP